METRVMVLVGALALAGVLGGVKMYRDMGTVEYAQGQHTSMQYHPGAVQLVEKELSPIRKDVKKNKRKLETIDKRQIRQNYVLEGIADKLNVHTPKPIPEDREREEDDE